MAERNNLSHTQRARDKIRTSQLIERLQDNALAEKEFLTAGQIKSAIALINKTCPDLRAMELTVDQVEALRVRWDDGSRDNHDPVSAAPPTG